MIDPSKFTLSEVLHYAKACNVDYLSMLRHLRTDAFALKQFNEWRGLSAGGAR